MLKWNSLSQVAYKMFVGARGSPSLYSGLDQFFTVDGINHTSKKDSSYFNYGHIYDNYGFLDEVARHKLVFVGEIHSMPPIVALQQAIQERLRNESSVLHVVLEHFSFEMQDMLRQYQDDKITFDEMLIEYRRIGTENHDLEPYRPLLEHAKKYKQEIRLHAGFLSRSFARKLIKEGEPAVLEAASEYLPTQTSLSGNDFHYNLFESLISGRSLHKTDAAPPSDQFRGIFKAQILKDVAMAHKVNCLLEDSRDNESERFLVIAGNGHLMHYQGVPERVLAANPDLVDETCLVVSHVSDVDLEDKEAVAKEIEDAYGPPGANPADFLYVFRPEEVAAKEETAHAYDKVGETAHLRGHLKRAKAIMSSLGYTDEEFKVAGQDAYNFQGVGNPHLHAKIQPGERVLDVGSGLGVDSFIAYHYAGEDGKVIGIDISNQEVKHAQARAADRELDIRFAVADMEEIPLPENSVDVVISNGAFCLAPNKEKAFREIYRVLKPGGRMSICTSTLKGEELEPGVSWPLCMRMFIQQKKLQPLCESIGFENVFVDDSDSLMSYELPEEADVEETNPERSRVHVGSKEFEHLEEYDMNKICARVCVVARKPL